MSRNISPQNSLDIIFWNAAAITLQWNVGCLPVSECGTGRLVGIITDRDLVVRVMSAGLDPSSTRVFLSLLLLLLSFLLRSFFLDDPRRRSER